MTQPFQHLESLSSEELFSTLDQLKPQAIAIILYFLPTLISRKALLQFATPKKKDIIKKMEILAPLENESMLALSEIILDKMKNPSNRIEINGQKILKDIVSHASPELKKLIKSIATNAPTPNILPRVSFEELDKIPNKYFQKLIKEIDRKTLLLAIKIEADRFITKLKENLSQGAIDILNTDIRDFGAAKKVDVMQAKERIITLAYNLEAKGLLVFEDSEEYIN